MDSSDDVPGASRRRLNAKVMADFAARLEALAPDAWDRITVRCAELDAPDFGALVKRAGRFASVVTSGYPMSAIPRSDKVGFTAVLTGFGIVHELALEFRGSQAVAWDAARAQWNRRADARPSGDARRAAPAYFVIRALAESKRMAHPGVATAIKAAAWALLFKGDPPDPEVLAAYAPFEPEIALATLGVSAGPPGPMGPTGLGLNDA